MLFADVVIVAAEFFLSSASKAAIFSSFVKLILSAAKTKVTQLAKSLKRLFKIISEQLSEQSTKLNQPSARQLIHIQLLTSTLSSTEESPVGGPLVSALQLVVDVAAPVAILGHHSEFILA